MPLEGEKADQPFKGLQERAIITVIGHTHLCNALQTVLEEQKREATISKDPTIVTIVRTVRFAPCTVLINPTTQEATQVCKLVVINCNKIELNLRKNHRPVLLSVFFHVEHGNETYTQNDTPWASGSIKKCFTKLLKSCKPVCT